MDEKSRSYPVIRTLVLVRHGQSTANAEHSFTSNRDVSLTPLGREQARSAGHWLRQHFLYPDAVFCSTRTRTAESAGLILSELGNRDLAVETSAALDERDYGALTGLTHTEAETRWGPSQGAVWRRAFTSTPPGGESLRCVLARVAPFTITRILPAAMRGVALVVSHGNTLRALIAALENLASTEVEMLNVPTGSLRLYRFAADASIVSRELHGYVA